MLRSLMCCVPLLLCGPAMADDTAAKTDSSPAKTSSPAAKAESPPAKTNAAESDAKVISGMSILGNQEAPKSLTIVPWKSSQIGDMTTFSRILDETTQPVDKEVFLRELAYYQIRSE